MPSTPRSTEGRTKSSTNSEAIQNGAIHNEAVHNEAIQNEAIHNEAVRDGGEVGAVRDRPDFETAAVRERVVAYLLDLLVVGGSVVAVARRLGDSPSERVRLGSLLGLAVANLYHVVLEGRDGQTVGKRAVGIAVVTDDGERCTYGPAGIRTGFRFVDWLPIGYLLGFASIALTERRKRLGDVAANTVVVRTDGREGSE